MKKLSDHRRCAKFYGAARSTITTSPPAIGKGARSDGCRIAYHFTGQPAKRGKRWRDAPFERRGPIFADPEYYAVVGPLEGLDQKPYHASMADDVGDISLTMAEALWRLETNGRADAHWFLRTMQHHWEMHLRELSLYLHAKRFRFPARRAAASELAPPSGDREPSDGGRDAA